jgi:subtilisin family serine protease
MTRIAALLLAFTASVASDPDAKLDPWLASALHRETRAPFLVRFDTSESLRSRLAASSAAADAKRGVYESLTARSRSAQARVRTWLDTLGIPYRSLYIVNALRLEGDLALARSLAARPEVARIVGDPLVFRVEAWEEPPASPQESAEWGVSAVHAPQVWSTDGAMGQGIVVASADTGVDWTHPALRPQYRGWDGSVATHDYNWHDPVGNLAAPFDDHGHGTHTTGTMVGDDGAGNQVGVAPRARWIGCRNMNAGWGSPSLYLECIQFFLAPWPRGGDPETDGNPALAPDIVNNSWGCPPDEGCDPDTLAGGFVALQAAGILAVVSAGNSGPSCSSVDVPPPIYEEGFVVGATTSSGRLADYSSRGPVAVDGSGRLRPDIAAPGSSVRSSTRGGAYGYSSGTSMAGPHVAGSAALLWSARPHLRERLDLTRCLLTRSAGPVTLAAPQACGGTDGSTRPNNLFGWGLVDPYAALHALPDDDGDGIGDACDCNASDGTAFASPSEVRGVGFDAGGTTLRWVSMALEFGSGTRYELVRGALAELRSQGTIAGAECLAASLLPAAFTDAQVPGPGDGFYYVIRARNACGEGGWGSTGTGAPREHAECP